MGAVGAERGGGGERTAQRALSGQLAEKGNRRGGKQLLREEKRGPSLFVFRRRQTGACALRETSVERERGENVQGGGKEKRKWGGRTGGSFNLITPTTLDKGMTLV